MPAIILTFLLCLWVVAPTTPLYASQPFSKIWSESMPLMNKGMEAVAEGGDLNKRSFTEVITFRDSKFQRIIAECFEILADSETLDLLKKRDSIQKNIQRKRQKIVEAQKEIIAAPDEHWNPLKSTKTSLKRDIENLKKDIASLEASLDQAKEQALELIKARGVPITKEQMETLLSAADGEDTASIMAVAENVKQIQLKIEEVVQSPDSSVELLKTYTGIYMMCHKVYAYAIQNALERIDKIYLVKLEKLRKEAYGLLSNAKEMLRDANASDLKILETNVAANQRTLEVISMYNQYLKRQKQNLERLLITAQKSANVAVNTYRTVKTSTDLLRMMRASYGEFAKIFEFEPPDVSLLYGDRLKGEFEAISAKLKLER